jgi:hypothetical protein
MINISDDTERLHYCKFCNRALSLPYPLTQWNKFDRECKGCNTSYELNEDGSIMAITIANGNYYADFDPDGTFEINVVNNDPTGLETTIIALPYWPNNINPTNFLAKAKLYTTFS